MDHQGDYDRVADALKFLSVQWLAQKERSAIERAKMATTSVMAMAHEDEASRCRSTIIQLQTLRADNAVLAAEVQAWRIGLKRTRGRGACVDAQIDIALVRWYRDGTDASGALARAKETP